MEKLVSSSSNIQKEEEDTRYVPLDDILTLVKTIEIDFEEFSMSIKDDYIMAERECKRREEVNEKYDRRYYAARAKFIVKTKLSLPPSVAPLASVSSSKRKDNRNVTTNFVCYHPTLSASSSSSNIREEEDQDTRCTNEKNDGVAEHTPLQVPLLSLLPSDESIVMGRNFYSDCDNPENENEDMHRDTRPETIETYVYSAPVADYLLLAFHCTRPTEMPGLQERAREDSDPSSDEEGKFVRPQSPQVSLESLKMDPAVVSSVFSNEATPLLLSPFIGQLPEPRSLLLPPSNKLLSSVLLNEEGQPSLKDRKEEDQSNELKQSYNQPSESALALVPLSLQLRPLLLLLTSALSSTEI